MVKGILFFLLLFSFTTTFAESKIENNLLEEVVSKDNLLIGKIKSFLSEDTYNQNIDFINVIFEPNSAFYEQDRVNSVKVAQTLKENGLLKLFLISHKSYN